MDMSAFRSILLTADRWTPICSATSRCVRPRSSRTSDIIYLARDDVRLYFNQSGNRWSEARPFSLTT